ncbi:MULTISPECIES: phage regulatory CII family protein [unclassified Psychrobacter]|uniref:phage regulatory CII family protein n=1 Tax=unclassified Psychrobacter TaxID=196806 RepID=UPI0018F4B4C4|nr:MULTISPECIES: phage regulatory CII family protein [unclassified Psychrobacter]
MRNPMNVIDAAFNTAHNYPHGGVEALAGRMGLSAAILRNKVNGNATAHHLRLDEAVKMMQLTGDHSIAHAIAHCLNGVYCDVSVEATQTQTEDLIMTALAASASSGSVIQELHDALEDGRISCDQRITLHTTIQSAMSELQLLMRHVDAKHAEDNPHIVAQWQAEEQAKQKGVGQKIKGALGL